MSNFEYIIASLPYLTTDFKYAGGQGFENVIEEIKENLGEKDTEALDFLLKGLKGSELNPDFYAEALKHSSKFVRSYFSFDLNLRNAKVRSLNARDTGGGMASTTITLEVRNVDELKAIMARLATVPGVKHVSRSNG